MKFKKILLFSIMYSTLSFSSENVESIKYEIDAPKVIVNKHDIKDYSFNVSDEKKEELRKIIRKSVLGEKSKESLSAISERIKSKKWNSEVDSYRKTIASKINVEIEDGDLSFNPKDRMMIFISESIPLKTLRNYARDLEKIGGVFVMRGMVGGLKKVKPQALFSADILKLNKECKTTCDVRRTEVLVDPIMFQKYNIKKVPAFVVQSGLDIFDYCHSKDKFDIESSVIYGDASLKYVLEKYKEIDERESIKKFYKILM
jgi:type-F conjugative transfer system pilin assembly protein TrbC